MSSAPPSDDIAGGSGPDVAEEGMAPIALAAKTAALPSRDGNDSGDERNVVASAISVASAAATALVSIVPSVASHRRSAPFFPCFPSTRTLPICASPGASAETLVCAPTSSTTCKRTVSGVCVCV